MGKPVFALNDDMELDIESIVKFFEEFRNEKVFIFGFTFVIWQFFIKELRKKKIRLNKVNGVLIHGGGGKN